MADGDIQMEGKLLLISNRLPITIKRSEDGKYDFSMSSGGLVSGLSGLSKSTTFQWYGWPGLEVPENEVPTLKSRLKEEYNAVPVMLDDELADKHYNGFSSSCGPGIRDITFADLRLQTRYYGPSSTTIPQRLPLMNPHGMHIQKPIDFLPRRSPKI